ncbi:glycosyltransferase [Prolixibacter sp. SD074]|uniref:glycosyltransferase n=1 Tax=Prolixibacter sp. SD074 TaxID=2652391 RepID=UPI00126FC59E|nr:glycosyltransferase [Prolixibacter sp. SD074]GET30935.1 hypothetical protein SD074_31370 [Prolixibacter sp. SD074]
MKLSVVIVNYNVRFFLSQCLASVQKASEGLEVEVFVVDNNSTDGSYAMLRDSFPWINLIANHENVGFSKANNQAIRKVKGEYILLLNPDTIVQEDTFSKVIAFMDGHPKAGGLGVRMIDGGGNFLPESKRGFPTPLASFYKIFGFTRLFPRSRVFSRYYLGHLPEDETNRIDVLAGAFMLLRKETLEQTGLLDETFFMYGEDIDLSYRIQHAGYENYYFPETTIIHYKGESTRKGSFNYVRLFYKAMLIFVRKHYLTSGARLFSLLVRLAIFFRAFLSLLKRGLAWLWKPLVDALLMFAGFSWLVPVWGKIAHGPGYYPEDLLQTVIPFYVLLFVFALALSGAYHRRWRVHGFFRSWFTAVLVLLVAYSLMSENMRFSRAIILMGAGWGLLTLLSARLLMAKLGWMNYPAGKEKSRRIVSVGSRNQNQKVREILVQQGTRSQWLGSVVLNEEDETGDTLGTLAQLPEIVRINGVDEVVYCAEDVPTGEMIRSMARVSSQSIRFRIYNSREGFFIASHSANDAGDLILFDINAISLPENRRRKRTLDVSISALGFILSPFLFPFIKSKKNYLSNIFNVLKGNRTWVGYSAEEAETDIELPVLLPGVLSCADRTTELKDLGDVKKINTLYAKDYRIWNDLEIIRRNISKLGNTTSDDTIPEE